MSGFHVRNMLDPSRTITVAGATVVYNPQALAVADYQTLDAVEQGERWSSLIDVLAKMVISWDLVDDEGPVPVTSEGIRRLPMIVMDKIMAAIEEDSGPSEAEGKDSSGGFSTLPSPIPSEELAETSPNGGDSSRQHVTSALPPGTSPDSPLAG